MQEMFLAWAPGQRATMFGADAGIAVDEEDFIVLQIHYHFDVEAPSDRSALMLDMAEEVANEIDVTGYAAPAEIPCTESENGPLCAREEAMSRAIARYGSEGVLADAILASCGFSPEDFAAMTSGVASSHCDLPVRAFGQIVAVAGHEHELGSRFRLTLNPGTSDEVVLLDIPEWDFDWQYFYFPIDDIELGLGDVLRVECEWDRSLRDPALESAYVLWADGTDDEMCFSVIITQRAAARVGRDE